MFVIVYSDSVSCLGQLKGHLKNAPLILSAGIQGISLVVQARFVTSGGINV